MRITSLNIPAEKIDNGLKPIKMQKLGQVVLLAGKNGAGKTRVLNTIMQLLVTKDRKPAIEAYLTEVVEQEKGLISCENNLKQLQIDLSCAHNPKTLEAIDRAKKKLNRITQRLSEIKEIINSDLIITNELYDEYIIIPFVPKNLKLVSSDRFSRDQIEGNARGLDAIGVNNLSDGTYARIELILSQHFNCLIPETEVSKEEIKLANDEYLRLRKTIKLFLGTDLKRDKMGRPLLFGLPFREVNLSDGQKVLLQLCLAIHCQVKSLNEVILVLDEPENHLHPSILIETIEIILKNIPKGQIWISTHSIPLLSHFDPSCLWFVDEGEVSYAGAIPEKVLESLLGNDEQIQKLQDFISLPNILALNRYAFESLFHPESVETGKDDLQTLQIREEIKKHLSDKNKLRILDYGAGKGRLLTNIIEHNESSPEELISWLDFVAFDKFDPDKDYCLSVLKRIYSDTENRYFNDFTDIFNKQDRESFDVVIMSNVLHEIDPNEWLTLFSKDIPSLLNKNGVLLIIEDQEMPIGEKAHQKGFIVFDTSELKILFDIKEADVDFGINEKREGRLKAHRLPKECLSRITANTRVAALRALHNKSTKKIKDIREKDVNYKNGKKHGFWIQQLANSTLCLEELNR